VAPDEFDLIFDLETARLEEARRCLDPFARRWLEALARLQRFVEE
jgi:hypothetical protein